MSFTQNRYGLTFESTFLLSRFNSTQERYMETFYARFLFAGLCLNIHVSLTCKDPHERRRRKYFKLLRDIAGRIYEVEGDAITSLASALRPSQVLFRVSLQYITIVLRMANGTSRGRSQAEVISNVQSMMIDMCDAKQMRRN